MMSVLSTKEKVAREVWLHYFNHYLFEQGIITEQEFRKMNIRIQACCGEKSKI